MPRRDGRGPMGLGAMTGRGLGPCRELKGFKYLASIVGIGLVFGLICGHIFRPND